MFNINIVQEHGMIKVLNNGILIIEDISYTKIVSTITRAIKIIQDDEYQLNLLSEILKQVNVMGVA